jgi:uncharacterized membrane protein YdjX (TVP38/TMEM64 family)
MIGPAGRPYPETGDGDGSPRPGPAGDDRVRDPANTGRPGSWWERLRARARSLTRKQIVTGLLVLAALVGVALGWRSIDMEAFHAWMQRRPASVVTAVIGVFPLGGFPVSALHLAAGVRFPFWTALFVVGLTTLFHHAGAWALVRALPDRFFSRLAPWREKLEGAGHVEASVLCSILPGMPYTVQLYLLPMMRVPLGTICLVAGTLHTARASVTVILGNISADLTVGRVTALALYYLAIAVVCGFTVRRMRRGLAAARARGEGRADAGPADGELPRGAILSPPPMDAPRGGR